MKLLGRIILIALAFATIPCVMALSIIVLKETGHELDGSYQFWFVTIVAVICSMSLFINALQLMDKNFKLR